MSSLFDRLEDQLRGAAQAQVAGRDPAGAAPAAGRRRRGGRRAGAATRLPGWLTTGGRMLPAGLALASAAAVVVVALLLLHPGRGTPTPATPPPGAGPALPLPGSPLARREMRQVQRLLAPVQRSAVCRVASLDGRPSTLPGRPGDALLREFAVLDRPATGADRAPVDLGLQGVTAYVHAERRARVSDGTSIFLVPIDVRPWAGQPSVRCLDAQARAVRRGARSIPAGIRTQTVGLVRRLIAYTRRIVTRAPYDSICLVEVRGRGSADDCDSTNPRTLAHVAVPPLDSGSPLRRPAYIAAVPNDVASATLSLPPSDGHAAITLHGNAVGNVLVIPAPRWLAPTNVTAPYHGPPQPTHVEWLGRSGRVIAQLTVPKLAARDVCAHHRLQCLLLQTGTSSHSASSGTATSQLQISTTAN